MKSLDAAAAFLVAGCLVLSGCSNKEGGQPPGDTDASRTITDPRDFSYLENDTGNRSHIHDYWGGADSAVLVDQESFRVAARSVNGPEYVHRFVPNPGRTVWSGTEWINITIAFDAPPPVPMNFAWTSPILDTWGLFEDIEGSTTYSIHIGENLTDPPHSMLTRWALRIVATETKTSADLEEVTGTAHVEIVRRDGPLTPAPPHPDFWRNGSRVTVYEVMGRLDEPRAGLARDADGRPPAIGRMNHLVPPGTTHLDVHFQYNSSTDPSRHYMPTLRVEGANVWSEPSTHAPTAANRQRTDGRIHWNLTVSDEAWDSPYSPNSQWRFYFDWYDGSGQGTPVAAVHMTGDYHLVFQAVRHDAAKAGS